MNKAYGSAVGQNAAVAGEKRVTLAYIARYLSDAGLDIRRDDHSVFINLGCSTGPSVRLSKGVLSVSIAMSADIEEIGNLPIMASMTMARTVMTKIFSFAEDDHLSVCFVVEFSCKTRKQFEELFAISFKQLQESVRTYFDIRDSILESREQEALAEFLMKQNPQGRLN